MSNLKTNINHRILALALTTALTPGYLPACLAADGELNFKIYSPEKAGTTETPTVEDGRIKMLDRATQVKPPSTTTAADSAASPQEESSSKTSPSTEAVTPQTGSSTLTDETPLNDTAAEATAPKKQESAAQASQEGESPVDGASASSTANQTVQSEENVHKAENSKSTEQGESDKAQDQATADTSADKANNAPSADKGKVLKGYVQVVPSGTKIPIIMDTAVDSDTSQEGDEFSARTAEDLTIDGTAVVPAGSIIRGRIATLNTPKHLNRSGSVALKFDTVTTPDNRQIPLVANLVARGGVVHARRGLRDVAIETGIAALPTLAGVGIGAVAGNSGSSKIGMGGGALIGAGVGVAVGVAILLAKKGKKVDVRPGDELKIELAEDLHMPTM
jgi:hypothetical protein